LTYPFDNHSEKSANDCTNCSLCKKVSVLVCKVDRIIIGVRIPVRADARHVRIERIGGEEPGDDGVVVAGIEIEQPGQIIMALADEPLAFGGGGDGGGLAKRSQCLTGHFVTLP
jgi:hypothetical protein